MNEIARRVIRIDPSDVLPAFDKCCAGNGWVDIDCQALSPDGLHKCYDDGDESHDSYEHWCECDESWPLAEDEIGSGTISGESFPFSYGADRPSYAEWDRTISSLGNLRTPEADRPDREEPAWLNNAIGSSIEHVEDPGLRRLFEEEHNRR